MASLDHYLQASIRMCMCVRIIILINSLFLYAFIYIAVEERKIKKNNFLIAFIDILINNQKQKINKIMLKFRSSRLSVLISSLEELKVAEKKLSQMKNKGNCKAE